MSLKIFLLITFVAITAAEKSSSANAKELKQLSRVARQLAAAVNYEPSGIDSGSLYRGVDGGNSYAPQYTNFQHSSNDESRGWQGPINSGWSLALRRIEGGGSGGGGGGGPTFPVIFAPRPSGFAPGSMRYASGPAEFHSEPIKVGSGSGDCNWELNRGASGTGGGIQQPGSPPVIIVRAPTQPSAVPNFTANQPTGHAAPNFIRTQSAGRVPARFFFDQPPAPAPKTYFVGQPARRGPPF